jgi:glycosyltransferase involved in cell wall biosynthesis
MRILQVASSLHDWGGIERYIHYLAEGMTARGHEVVVACPPESPLARNLKVETIPITMRGKHNPASALPYLRLFRSRKFDVVHAHFSPDFVMPAWAARVTRQPLTILTRHVVLAWSARKVRGYLKLFNHIIPVSDAVRRELEASGVPSERMTVAKAGVPALQPKASTEQVRTQYGVSGFVVGSFGRLVKEKGVETLRHAIDLTSKPLTVAVFGDGPEKRSLEARATDAFRLFGRIEFVADAMNAVDAVSIPSVWEEAFPYSALEAMSLAKPIVASNVGGMPELVQPEVNGLLYEKGDIRGLAMHLDFLASQPQAGLKMGEAGREFHRSQYTLAHMAERIEGVYRSQLERK